MDGTGRYARNLAEDIRVVTEDDNGDRWRDSVEIIRSESASFHAAAREHG
jgi:hypothetical protein